MTELSPVDPLIFTDSRAYDPAMSNTMREQVKTWLGQRGYVSGKAASEKNMNWMLEAKKQGIPFSFLIGEPAAETDSLIFMTIARFSDSQLHINALSSEEHKDLLFRMRFRLMNIDIKFDLAEDLSKVTFTQHHFQDEITRGEFWRTIALLSKAVLCVQWTLDEQFGPFDTGDSNGSGH